MGVSYPVRLFVAEIAIEPLFQTEVLEKPLGSGMVTKSFLYATAARLGSTTEVICKAMKVHARYRHLHVDWVGESSTQSITLCGVEGENIGTGQTLCPDCVQVGDALNVCGLGPESLRELFDTLRVIDPSEVKAKMEALRDLGVQMDMQDRSQLN